MLAAPLDFQANEQLVDLLSRRVVDRMWIGGEKRNNRWRREAIDGAWLSLPYTRWAPGQPDGGGDEGCIEMWTTGLWNDAPCDHYKTYACEVPQPQQHMRFDCSPGVLTKLAQGHADHAQTQCTYEFFGADGKRSSTIKQEFEACSTLCQQAAVGSQIAEPRTATQLQYLARILRRSGDDGMWVGLTLEGRSRWRWAGSNESLSAADASWAPGHPELNPGWSCVSLWPDGTYHARGCSRDTRAKKVCPCEVPIGLGLGLGWS